MTTLRPRGLGTVTILRDPFMPTLFSFGVTMVFGAKKDTAGRLYLVSINGERCTQPRKLGPGLDPSDGQRRPSSISPHVWWNMMTKAERAQWWLDYPDAQSAAKALPSVDCSPLVFHLYWV